jgi:hypothetical protein
MSILVERKAYDAVDRGIEPRRQKLRLDRFDQAERE